MRTTPSMPENATATSSPECVSGLTSTTRLCFCRQVGSIHRVGIHPAAGLHNHSLLLHDRRHLLPFRSPAPKLSPRTHLAHPHPPPLAAASRQNPISTKNKTRKTKTIKTHVIRTKNKNKSSVCVCVYYIQESNPSPFSHPWPQHPLPIGRNALPMGKPRKKQKTDESDETREECVVVYISNHYRHPKKNPSQ